MRPAQRSRGCRFAQIYRWADDDQRIEYVEEWEEAGELRGQFRTERFVHLLELLETAAERPVLEFRPIAETHGLEYITEQKASETSDR
jgi:quinol monooxygenase YgiN